MRPTHRGVAVFGIALGALLMAALFGARALNAVVAPALIALVAAGLQLRGHSAPSVTRELPPTAIRGETIPVRLHVDPDDPFPGAVRDTFQNAGEEPIAVDTVVGTHEVTAEVTCRQRGEATFGPVEIVAEDVLGLLTRQFTVNTTDSLLVYPRVSPLKQHVQQELVALGQVRRDDGRESFEHLREYERGDTLRDVNWKASAKRDGLVVTEYGADRPNIPVQIAAGGTDADGFADATASLTVALLDAGIPVSVRTPETTVDIAQPERRQHLLTHLAQVGPGTVPDTDADVVVRAQDGRTSISLGESVWEFQTIVSSTDVGESVETEVGLRVPMTDTDTDERDSQGVHTAL